MAALLTALALLLASACGSSSDSARRSATGAPTSSPTVGRASGQLTVFAAASLTEAFHDGQVVLMRSDPKLQLTYSFAGSGALVTQIQQGAPADVVATADVDSMRKLVDVGLVETPVVFARNELEILVAPGNPKQVMSLADLARADLKVVLADESVPAGKYAAQSLSKAAVTVHPVSKEVDVKAAVAKVTGGEADATIVYVTDVRAAGARGTGVQIPAAQNVVADYPVAIVKSTKNRPAADVFIDAVLHGSLHTALSGHGFLPGP